MALKPKVKRTKYVVNDKIKKLVAGVDEDQSVEQQFTRRIPEEGPTFARFMGYVELGMHPQTFGNDVKPPARMVRLTFELLHPKTKKREGSFFEVEKDGVKKVLNQRISTEMAIKMNSKSGFFKLFQAMRYGRTDITHMSQMLGDDFVLNIKHKKAKTSDAVYAVFMDKGAMPLVSPPFVTDPTTDRTTYHNIPAPLGEPQLFLWNKPNRSTWGSLFIDGSYEYKDKKTGKDVKQSKNFIQEKIVSAVNFPGSPLEAFLERIGELDSMAKVIKGAKKSRIEEDLDLDEDEMEDEILDDEDDDLDDEDEDLDDDDDGDDDDDLDDDEDEDEDAEEDEDEADDDDEDYSDDDDDDEDEEDDDEDEDDEEFDEDDDELEDEDEEDEDEDELDDDDAEDDDLSDFDDEDETDDEDDDMPVTKKTAATKTRTVKGGKKSVVEDEPVAKKRGRPAKVKAEVVEQPVKRGRGRPKMTEAQKAEARAAREAKKAAEEKAARRAARKAEKEAEEKAAARKAARLAKKTGAGAAKVAAAKKGRPAKGKTVAVKGRRKVSNRALDELD